MATTAPPAPTAETITFTDPALGTCTSNDVPWCSRDTQPSQTSARAPQGNFSGGDYFGHAESFYVASGGTALDNVYVANTYLTCSVGTDSVADANYLTIPTLSVAVSGSFSATSSTSGLVAGEPATITDVFRGNIESLASDGHERAAGTFPRRSRSPTLRSEPAPAMDAPWCRARHPAQPDERPRAQGNFSGGDYFGHAESFYVASGGTALDNVYVANTYLTCSVGTDSVADANYLTIPT